MPTVSARMRLMPAEATSGPVAETEHMTDYHREETPPIPLATPALAIRDRSPRKRSASVMAVDEEREAEPKKTRQLQKKLPRKRKKSVPAVAETETAARAVTKASLRRKAAAQKSMKAVRESGERIPSLPKASGDQPPEEDDEEAERPSCCRYNR